MSYFDDHPSDFQEDCSVWAHNCVGPVRATNMEHRALRFLEEGVELSQASGLTEEQCIEVVKYVFSRPVGEPAQEVGGVLVTLAILATTHLVQMDHAGRVELKRAYEHILKIRQKDLDKPIQRRQV